MSGPMSSGLGGYHQIPVTCTSNWLCDEDLCSVLNVSCSENCYKEGDNTSGECCVYLEPAASLEAGTPCSLFLSGVGREKNRILSVSIRSQARTIEVYSISSDGQEEEYLGSCRGEKFCTLPSKHREESAAVLYEAHLKLDFPIFSCKVKLLSLAGQQRVAINKISVEMTPAIEKCSQPSFGMGSSINLDRVQSIVDSMGGKMSPGAEQLMSMVRAQQKHQIPFGSHLLQFFGNFDRSTEGGQLNRLGTQIPPVNKVPEMSPEINQTKDSQLPAESFTSSQSTVPTNNDLKTQVYSFLQNPANGIAGASDLDSLMPLLRNLCVEQSQCPTKQAQGRQPQETREGTAALEKLVSLHIERMEKSLMQHIDQRMKDLQEHLDARLDGLLSVIQNSNSLPRGRAGGKLVNGQSDYSGEQNGDCTVLSNYHIADTTLQEPKSPLSLG